MTIASTPSLATAELVAPQKRTLLHVGCGMADPSKVPAAFFPAGEWRELRIYSLGLRDMAYHLTSDDALLEPLTQIRELLR